MSTAVTVDEFEALRPYLLSVAYRLTGTFADAEDAAFVATSDAKRLLLLVDRPSSRQPSR